MKGLLSISLCLNLLLISGVAFLVHKRQAPHSASVRPNRVAQPSRTMGSNSPIDPPAQLAATNTPFHWSQIESDDYVRYVANLRAIGCPEPILRSILTADINELYYQKRLLIWKPMCQNFWNFATSGSDSHPLGEAAEKELENLKADLNASIEAQEFERAATLRDRIREIDRTVQES